MALDNLKAFSIVLQSMLYANHFFHVALKTNKHTNEASKIKYFNQHFAELSVRNDSKSLTSKFNACKVFYKRKFL